MGTLQLRHHSQCIKINLVRIEQGLKPSRNLHKPSLKDTTEHKENLVHSPLKEHGLTVTTDARGTKKWTHWDLNPGPSACEADVIPLHHEPSDICCSAAGSTKHATCAVHGLVLLLGCVARRVIRYASWNNATAHEHTVHNNHPCCECRCLSTVEYTSRTNANIYKPNNSQQCGLARVGNIVQ